MIEANRIKELADRLRSDQARQNGISQREMESCADLLDELSRIKSAALGVPEIEKRHAKMQAACELLEMTNPEECPSIREHVDRATLLDALRAKEADQEEVLTRLADEKMRSDAAVFALNEPQKALELAGAIAEVYQHRDDARAQLAPAQKEIESLKADAEESRQLRDIAIKSLAARTQELDRAESDKAALREGLRSIRSLVAKFTRPPLSDEQLHFCADALELLDALVPLAADTRQPARDRFENQVIPEEMIQRAILKPGQAASLGSHVAIDNDGSVVTAEQYNAALTANRDSKPDQGRYLLPPGRWLVGETTVKLEVAEYVCKGSWALGTACGTCRKCLETKAEQTDKERG